MAASRRSKQDSDACFGVPDRMEIDWARCLRQRATQLLVTAGIQHSRVVSAKGGIRTDSHTAGDSARTMPAPQTTPEQMLSVPNPTKTRDRAGHLLPRICTIGYEGASVDRFVATLKSAGVTRLLDVRELPLSRRRGFSKGALSVILEGAGIAYQHERALGAPRLLRHRLREDKNLARYFAEFHEYLATQRTFLDKLARELTEAVVLLCYERNPAECHRSVVAAALALRLSTRVEDLHVNEHEQAPRAARAHSRQGLSAAE